MQIQREDLMKIQREVHQPSVNQGEGPQKKLMYFNVNIFIDYADTLILDSQSP